MMDDPSTYTLECMLTALFFSFRIFSLLEIQLPSCLVRASGLLDPASVISRGDCKRLSTVRRNAHQSAEDGGVVGGVDDAEGGGMPCQPIPYVFQLSAYLTFAANDQVIDGTGGNEKTTLQQGKPRL